MRRVFLGLVLAAATFAVEAVDLSGEWRVTATNIDARIVLPGTLGGAKLGRRWTPEDFRTCMDFPQMKAMVQEYQFEGPATYWRTVELAEKDCCGDAEIFLERVMWKSEAWFDGVRLGERDSLATPHVYSVPRKLLTVGRHEVKIVVDNSCRYNFSRYSHSYGPSMQAVWNGVLGRCELRAANPLRAARVFAAFPSHGRLAVEVPDAFSGTLTVDGLGVGAVTETRSPYRDGFKLLTARLDREPVGWNEFHPQLYLLTLKDATHGWRHNIRFGFRSVGTNGPLLTQNGNDLFLRGNIENANFAKDGVPWMTVGEWKRMLKTLKDEDGINAIRFHSWTPPEAAFAAADELGILLMPEADFWTDAWMTYADEAGNGKPVDAFLRRELVDILAAYGNSPSFFSLAIGNELGGCNFETMSEWIDEVKRFDPRRLYFCSTARTVAKADDYAVTHQIPGTKGLCRERLEPSTDWDYAVTYEQAKLPTVAHEIGQWPVYPVWDELLPKFTGMMRPWNITRHYDTAKREGTVRFNRLYAEASARLSRLIYKEEAESFLRTPNCAGVELLNIQDFTGQNEALVGWRDPFYDLKDVFRAMPPFRTVWGPVCKLARLPKRVWTVGETLTATLQVRNLKDVVLPKGTVFNCHLDGDCASARTLILAVDVPPGALVTVGTVSLGLTSEMIGRKRTLRFGENSWDFWVFPDERKCEMPEGVVLTADPAEMKRVVRDGGTVLYTGPSAGSATGKFKPVYWSARWFTADNALSAQLGTWFDRTHPALAGFPTENFTDWQWHDLAQGCTIHRIEGVGDEYLPIGLSVNDFHFSQFAATLWEVRVGKGRLFVCGYDIDKDIPPARRLRASLAAYLTREPAPGTPSVNDGWLDRRFEFARKEPFADEAVYDVRTNWVGRVFKLDLRGFEPVTGAVRIDFRQSGDGICSMRGKVDGHVFDVPLTWEKGKVSVIDVPIIREDMLDGKLALEVYQMMGKEFVVDRVQVRRSR